MMSNWKSLLIGIVVAIAAISLFSLSMRKVQQDVRRFSATRVPARVYLNNEITDTVSVFKTESGAFAVDSSERRYFVERTEKGWIVGVYVVHAVRESKFPGPDYTALVFPPSKRTGDWDPKLVVLNDTPPTPRGFEFTVIEGGRIRIELEDR